MVSSVAVSTVIGAAVPLAKGQAGKLSTGANVRTRPALPACQDVGMPPGSLTPPAAAVLASLDPDQRTAAEAVEGPVCILAGAGTGKTRTITHRIAYAVLTGTVEAEAVLAVTFTARAAGELRGRLRGLGVGGVQARTFHAAALRQLTYFWPQVIGGEPPRLVESKLRLVADAVNRSLRVSLPIAE